MLTKGEDHRGPIYFRSSELRVITAFGDIRGFRSWTRRVGKDQMRRTFEGIHSHWERFASSADLYKDMGDGFMGVWECRPNHNCKLATELMELALDTAAGIETVISQTPDPRPVGWRIRLVAGDVTRWTQRVGQRSLRDYLGPSINLAKELLYVDVETPAIVTTSFAEMVSAKQLLRARMALKDVRSKPHPHLNIFKEDLASLKRLERAF